jgi:hypothetical protein
MPLGRITQLNDAGVLTHATDSARPRCPKCNERMFRVISPFEWTCSSCEYTPPPKPSEPQPEQPTERSATATLTFPLPECEEEHHNAMHGGAYRALVCDIDNWLRDRLKYGHEYKDVDKALQDLRDYLYERKEDYSLQL